MPDLDFPGFSPDKGAAQPRKGDRAAFFSVFVGIGTDGKSPPDVFDVPVLIGFSCKGCQLTNNAASNLLFGEVFGEFFPEFFNGVEVHVNLPGADD